MDQKVTVEFVENGGEINETGMDIAKVCETFTELLSTLMLAIGGLSSALDDMKAEGKAETSRAFSIDTFINAALKVVMKAQGIVPTMPIIPQKEAAPAAKWEAQMQLYANGKPIGELLSKPVESLEDAIRWNSDMLNLCEKSAKTAGWEVLERGFDKHTGNGFLRHKHDGIGFQTRYRTIKDGEIYKGE